MKSLMLLLLFPACAIAACVDGSPTVQKEYTTSKVVLAGKVIRDHKMAPSDNGYFLDGDTYTVIPSHIYKGEMKAAVDFFSENSSGRFTMIVGQQYLIFAYEDHGRLIVDNCGNSAVISRATKTAATVANLSTQGK